MEEENNNNNNNTTLAIHLAVTRRLIRDRFCGRKKKIIQNGRPVTFFFIIIIYFVHIFRFLEKKKYDRNFFFSSRRRGTYARIFNGSVVRVRRPCLRDNNYYPDHYKTKRRYMTYRYSCVHTRSSRVKTAEEKI